MKFKKNVRAFLGANLILLFTFVFLPILIIKPDVELIQITLDYLNKD